MELIGSNAIALYAFSLSRDTASIRSNVSDENRLAKVRLERYSLTVFPLSLYLKNISDVSSIEHVESDATRTSLYRKIALHRERSLAAFVSLSDKFKQKSSPVISARVLYLSIPFTRITAPFASFVSLG